MRKRFLYVIGTVALLLMSFAPHALAAGNGSGCGGGGGDTGGEETTEVGNNLSVPAEFVPSSTTQGAPVLNVACAASPLSPQGMSAGGYWMAASDGGVFAFGSAPFYGSTGGVNLAKPVIAMASTPKSHGYWLVASDGGIFAFGDARFYGSTGGVALAKPIVGMASNPATGGYRMVASDGGVFAFNAPFYGSTGGVKLVAPIVGMAVDQATGGYWLVASDGGVFAFNAPFYGSTGGVKLTKPIIGMTASPTGKGYRLVASDGGVFAFGDAAFYGSTGGINLAKPIVGMANSVTSKGYAMVASDGGLFAFGDQPFYGSLGGVNLVKPIVGMATYPGYWLQGSSAIWSAYCADVPTATVTAQWGSNLKDSTALHADSPIRVEVALLDMAANGSPYKGYVVTNLTPTLEDRYATYGTDGTSFYSDGSDLTHQTRVWTAGATMSITGTTSAGTSYSLETPMAAEINSGGSVVFGFNWGGGNTGTTTPAGTYTLTFNINDGLVTVDAVVPGSAVQPTFNSTSTSITVTIK